MKRSKKDKVLYYDPIEPHLLGIDPIKKAIPQWYKAATQYSDGNDTPQFFNNNSALKLCAPFLDALTTGYMIVLTGDLVVEKDDKGNTTLRWGDTPLLVHRPSTAAITLPIPVGHSPNHYAWISNPCITIPKGYSAIFTHPFNRFDLPFTTLTGIVDDYDMQSGQIPFFIKENFEGIIPQGTPIVQIIPFKRENWASVHQEGLAKKAQLNSRRASLVLSGWYKKTHWKKKLYN
jgi:hypothetical protein